MPSARDRNRAAQVTRLRTEARRARHLAQQNIAPDDRQFYLQLADEWDKQAAALEQGGGEDRPERSRARPSRGAAREDPPPSP